MPGTVNYSSTFAQIVSLTDLEVTDDNSNLVVKNTSNTTPINVTLKVRFRDNNDANAMTIGIDNNAGEFKNENLNGTMKLTSGFKHLTIDEASNLCTVNTDLKSNSIKLAGSTSGTLSVVPAATTLDHTFTLPSAQGAADTYLKNDGSGNLSWTNQAVSTWALYSSATLIDVASTIVDLTNFRAGTNEDMLVRVNTSVYGNEFNLQRSLLADLATNWTTFEIGKYDTRYVLWQVSNSGDTLTITAAGGVTINKVHSWIR